MNKKYLSLFLILVLTIPAMSMTCWWATLRISYNFFTNSTCPSEYPKRIIFLTDGEGQDPDKYDRSGLMNDVVDSLIDPDDMSVEINTICILVDTSDYSWEDSYLKRLYARPATLTPARDTFAHRITAPHYIASTFQYFFTLGDKNISQIRLKHLGHGTMYPGTVTNIGTDHVTVSFPQVVLDRGANNIQLINEVITQSSATSYDTTDIVFYRKSAQLTAEEQDSLDAMFELTCSSPSIVGFIDSTGDPFIDRYSTYSYDSAYVSLFLDFGNDLAQDIDSVTITTASGDIEYIPVFESSLTSNTYRGTIKLIEQGAPTLCNGILECSGAGTDTLIVTYTNRSFIGDGISLDLSRDTILVKLNGTAIQKENQSKFTDVPEKLALTARSLDDGNIHFFISVPLSGTVNVQIFDVYGKRVWNYNENIGTAGFKNITWNSGKQIVNGLYFVELKNNKEKIVNRFVRMR